MKKFVLLLFFPIVLFSCYEDGLITEELNTELDLRASKTKLDLDFTGLTALGPNYRYEGWIIVNGSPVSTGKFNITPSGVMAPSVFNVNKGDLADATTFVLTIEPHPDPTPAPASTHVLAGDFIDGSASLNISHGAALGTDFLSASGSYILATPTSSSTADESSGIWFLNLESGSPMAGLNLPNLPAGWIYEGWTVIEGIPVTTGKFFEVDNFDLDDQFSSTMNPGPPFPGEDYIMNAPAGLTFPTDLSGGVAVISVEPYPDNGDEPFALKPLVGAIPQNAAVHTDYPMGLNPASFPTGTAIK